MKQSTLLAAFAKRRSSFDDANASAKRLKTDGDLDNSPGPSTLSPLSIRPPTFSVSSAYSDNSGRAITNAYGLDLLFFNPFLKAPGRKLLFDYLLQELPWYRVVYEARGMVINTPRWTCVWGCDDTGAPASKYAIAPRPIPDALRELKTRVEAATGAQYNFVLCNYYASGADSIAWHADDEAFLGPRPTIASLTLGGARDFCMKHKTDGGVRQERWTLRGGDMVVMRGTTQSTWLHSVPKRASAGGRMNMTFRRAMNVAGTNNYYRYNVGNGPVHRLRDGEMVQT